MVAVSEIKKKPHCLRQLSRMVEDHKKTVAVIGAGISGVCAAAHLLKQGLEVVVFERSAIAGGVWHYDKRSARDPSYPNEIPSIGDYKPTPEQAYSTPPPEDDDSDDFEIAHAPPGPCYAGLKNNVSTREMRVSLGPWPEGTEDVSCLLCKSEERFLDSV